MSTRELSNCVDWGADKARGDTKQCDKKGVPRSACETGVVEGTWKRSEAVSVVAAVAAVVAAVVDEVAGACAVADGDGGGGAWLAISAVVS